MAIRTLEEKGLSILFLSTGDGSSFLGGKERSRSKKRTDIGGLKEEKGLIYFFFQRGMEIASWEARNEAEARSERTSGG